MPFVRLIMIYAVVIAAVVAFFQRDRITQAFGLSGTAPEIAAPAPAQKQPDSQPQPAPAAPAPAQTALAQTAPAQTAPAQPAAPAAAATPAASSAAPSAPSSAPSSGPAPANQTAPTPPAPQQTQAPAPSRVQPLQTPVATPPGSETNGAAPTPTTQPQGSSAGANSIAARLDAARQAYWRGDLPDAETRYLALIESAPETPDALGELGNIYYAQRKYSAAANYYHLAALALLKEGNRAKVMAIISVLQTIAPAKAADLRGRLAK